MINGVRTGHSRLTRGYLMDDPMSDVVPECPLCTDAQLTVEHIDGSWPELTTCILGKIPLYAFTTILPICLAIDLTLINIIAQYDQNLKSTKK